MKIVDALNSAKKTLRANNINSFSLDAILLLQQATSFTKEQIIFDPDFLLDENQLNIFLKLIERRSQKEPVSHIIGKREFYGLDFAVTSKTLDPRPDSESLIELVLQNFSGKINILEIGVGSGCLIITLLKNLQEAQGKGIDISNDALEICHKNAKNHQIENRLQLLRSNLFAEISDQEKFDLIISNPPYIKSQDIENLQDEVKNFEPRLALDGGESGLEFYEKIANEVAGFLAPKGSVILEIGFGQKQDVVDIFVVKGFKLQAVKLDLSGIDRVLWFKKPPVLNSVYL